MPTLERLPRLRGLALLHVLEFGFLPQRFAHRHAAELGRTYCLERGPTTAVFTSDPEHARRIFTADSDALATYGGMALAWALGQRSVLVTSGPLHKRQRKLLSPPVTGARLRAFGHIMQEIAERHVDALAEGARFRALDLTTAFTLEVILRTVFGLEAHELDGELRPLVRALVDELPRSAVYVPRLRRRWYPPYARQQRVQRQFEAWTGRRIAERRASGFEGDDVLSLLMAARYDDGSPLDEAEICDQLRTLLLAGHETTSIALATCLDRIHRHPDVLARMRREVATVRTPEEAQRLPYLSAAIDETLRIDPVVVAVSRVPNKDFALDDELVVTPSEIVFVLMEALHHDRSIYPEPHRFRPERFLERKFAPHEFAPFGGGVRRCLGAAFSDYETKIMLATLLRRVQLEVTSTRPDRRIRRNVTVGPARGVPMRMVGRASA